MPSQEEFESPEVRVGKKGLTVHSSQMCEVKCRIRAFPGGGAMLFEPGVDCNLPDRLELFPALVDVPAVASKIVRIPIQNFTKHDIFLSPKTVLGVMEEIVESKPVNILPTSQKPADPHSDSLLCSTHVSSTDKGQSEVKGTQRAASSQEKWHPNVNLDHLSEHDQEVVKQTLTDAQTLDAFLAYS